MFWRIKSNVCTLNGAYKKMVAWLDQACAVLFCSGTDRNEGNHLTTG